MIVGLVYLAAYALLDWISFIEPYARFGITPWNPGTGLSFALLLLFGLRMIPFLLLAPLLAELLNQQLAMPWQVEIFASLLVGAGYSIALTILLRPNLHFDPTLGSMRDLVLLTAAAVVSAAFVASGYVSLMVATGLLPAGDFVPVTLRYWIGDVIGVMVVAPFALFAMTRRRILPMTTETLLQFVAIALALALVFGLTQEQQFQLFYVLFLPIVWLAVRAGSEGVSVGILATQLGLILGIQLLPAGTFDLTAFQALMLVLAMTGLIAGELVTERRRTESQLRLQQEQLARLARLGSMGELAAAVAHELNQPLMAAGTYTRLVNDAMSAGNDRHRRRRRDVEKGGGAGRARRRGRAPSAGAGAARPQQSRAVQVRADRAGNHRAVSGGPRPRAGRRPRTSLAADLPPVMVDLLQIEQVLINLVRNAIEAIGESGGLRGSVLIAAKALDADFVEVRVADTGPGFPPQLQQNAFLPLASTKAEGLGMGLSLCRSIVEAHGGQLSLEDGSQGAAIRFTLPIAKTPKP